MEPGGSSFRKTGIVVLYSKKKPLHSQPYRPGTDFYGCSQILYDRMEFLALEFVPGMYLGISSNVILPLADVVKSTNQ